MNAERLAEIRSMMDMPHFDGVQAWVVRELLDHIAQLEAQRGGAVVVAELKDSDDAWQDAAFRGKEYSAGLREGFDLAVSRIQPIPASQVLQPGMVGVDREELEVVNEFVTLQRKIDGGGDVDEEVAWHHGIIKAEKKIDRIRAIRSQAGEVNHAI